MQVINVFATIVCAVVFTGSADAGHCKEKKRATALTRDSVALHYYFELYMTEIKTTIAAIATGMTNAGIGIVRISGPDAVSVADRIYHSKKGKKASELEDHKLCLGSISDQDELIDEVLLCVMKTPHSYTGEDTVEINCHGGIFVCRKVLKLVLQNGARMAEPGEFSKRAFLNGKLDLSQAEAVMDLISSQNDFALRNSVGQLSGSVHDRIVTLREKILHELAYIEAALDDPEHFDLSDYPPELEGKIKDIVEDIQRLIRTSGDGAIRKNGIRTAILGKPNVGKSSLLNMLSGKESAIVTDIAGTTRDSIEESVRLGELQLNLVDTAGIHDTEDTIEKIGVERAKKVLDEAELVLFVADSSIPLDENDEEILKLIRDKKVVIVLNKTDLEDKIDRTAILKLLSDKAADPEEADHFDPEALKSPNATAGSEEVDERFPMVEISAKEGNGVDNLEKAISKMFITLELNEEVVITNLRQLEELKQACSSLLLVLGAIRDNMTEDIFAIDLMDAYTHLGYILGEEIGDDLVNKIFSEFCMGK